MADMDSSSATTATAEPAALRTWGICGLMLLATMLNYMDRLALSQQATEISRELELSNEQYGWIESGFGVAFAVGGIVTGFIADRISPRWLYPAVLLGWSIVGFATGWVTSYRELLVCRVLLGFFEAGQWPCALVSAQRLLSRRDRALGNSIIQSGASLGAVVTPGVVWLLTTDAPGSWRLPFLVIGVTGAAWVVAWLATVRASDLDLEGGAPELAPQTESVMGGPPGVEFAPDPSASRRVFLRRFLALAIVVVVINLCWQYFRAWMPKMLREEFGYSKGQVQFFSMAYYLVAGIGCLLIGFLAKWLAGRGLSVHGARMSTFLACSLLTALSVLAAALPASWLLLATLLVIGFGSLGQFPTYYAFTQELSARRMGNVTGILSFLTWMVYAVVSGPIGRWADRTGSYSQVTFLAGLLPMLGLLALLLLWNDPRSTQPAHKPINPDL
jgi:ACS family hexuronate transporter-like MFS transporter